jgi:hypothetical protein
MNPRDFPIRMHVIPLFCMIYAMSSSSELRPPAGMMRNSPVVFQWPWTTGIPLTAGRLDEEVEKLRHHDIAGMAVVFLDSIQVNRLFLMNMTKADKS